MKDAIVIIIVIIRRRDTRIRIQKARLAVDGVARARTRLE